MDDRLKVDTTIDETLLVTINISFPHVPCSQLHLDIQVCNCFLGAIRN